jgi:hypothetical protein
MNERRKEYTKEGERKEGRLAGGWNRRRYIVCALQQIQYGFYIKDTGFYL